MALLRIFVFAVASIFLAAVSGCAGLCDSSFSPIGPDTYQVRGTCGGPAEVSSAAPFCAQMGKNVLVTNIRGYGDGGVTIIRCLRSDDPDYRRLDYERSPSVIIQNK